MPGCQIRMAEKISLFKEVKATKREIADGRRRDRFHRPHADRQGLSRRLQRDAWRRARRPCSQTGGRARRRRSGGGGRRHSRLRAAGARDRRQYRAASGDPRRPAGHRSGHDGEPLLQFGAAGDRACGAAHHLGRSLGTCRRRLGKHQSGAGRQERFGPRRLDRGAQARDLHADDRHGRHRRRAL